MKDWPDLYFGMEPDPELQEADSLLEKADALLRKHRHSGYPGIGSDPDEDLPILTEVVEHFDEQDTIVPADLPPAPVEVAEFLIDLDTELAREIEFWFANELPQLLSSELDRVSERLRTEALGHMRATLIPALSERIAARLDKPGKS